MNDKDTRTSECESESESMGSRQVDDGMSLREHVEKTWKPIEDKPDEPWYLPSLREIAFALRNCMVSPMPNLLGRPDERLLEVVNQDPQKFFEVLRYVSEQGLVCARMLHKHTLSRHFAYRLVDVNRALNNALRIAEPVFNDRVRVSWELADDLWCVDAGVGMVEALLLPPIACAAHRMRESGGTLQLRTANSFLEPEQRVNESRENSPTLPHVSITISDTAPALAEGQWRLLLEPQRPSRQHVDGGNLVNLPGAVSELNGEFRYHSSAEEGNVLEILLPRMTGEEKAGQEEWHMRLQLLSLPQEAEGQRPQYDNTVRTSPGSGPQFMNGK